MSLSLVSHSLVSFCEDIAEDVRAHFQGFLAGFLRVVMHTLVFPTVAEVTLVGEDAHYASFIYQSEKLGRLVVVFVDFWQAIREGIRLRENLMRIRQLHEIQFGKHLFHLRLNVLAYAVVVVNVEETTSKHVVSEVLCLSCIENNIAVTRHIDVGIIEQIRTRRFHGWHIRVDVGANLLVAETHQIGE